MYSLCTQNKRKVILIIIEHFWCNNPDIKSALINTRNMDYSSVISCETLEFESEKLEPQNSLFNTEFIEMRIRWRLIYAQTVYRLMITYYSKYSK